MGRTHYGGSLRWSGLLGLAWLGFLTGAQAPGGASVVVKEFRYRTYRTWPAEFPECTWFWIHGPIRIEALGERQFLAEEQPDQTLKLDTTGDGRLDRHVKRAEMVVFSWQDAEAERAELALRFKPVYNRRDREHGWYFASGGAVEGRLGADSITIVDVENNGRYDDFNSDVAVLGRRAVNEPLQPLLAHDGVLYAVAPAARNPIPRLERYAGQFGYVQPDIGASDDAELIEMTIVDAVSGVRFPVHDPDQPQVLPVGSYRVASARIKSGAVTADLIADEMFPVTVQADRTSELSFGGPVRIRFDARRDGDEVELFAAKGAEAGIEWIGVANERYVLGGLFSKQKYQVEVRSPVQNKRSNGTVASFEELVGLRVRGPRNMDAGVEVIVRFPRTPVFGNVEGRILLPPE